LGPGPEQVKNQERSGTNQQGIEGVKNSSWYTGTEKICPCKQVLMSLKKIIKEP
jgi:hypothetical protein